jgi:hypothetical protein
MLQRDGKAHYMQAEDEADLKRWLSAFQQVGDMLQRSAASGRPSASGLSPSDITANSEPFSRSDEEDAAADKPAQDAPSDDDD